MAASYREILFKVEDNTAWIGINRPEVRNAFREQTLDELAHALESTRRIPRSWPPWSTASAAISRPAATSTP